MNLTFDELKTAGALPSPTGVAFEIIQLCQDENPSIEALTEVVMEDPVMTARILKLANTAANQLSERPIIAIKDAILKLGIRTLRSLALTFSVLDSQRSGTCLAFDYDLFWSSSLLRAVIVRTVCMLDEQRAGLHGHASDFMISAEEAFTIGLIAEIGRLVLAQTYPVQYSACLDGKQNDLLSQEQTTFSIDHDEITLALMKEWGLPSFVIDAMQIVQNANSVFEYGNSSGTEKFAAQLQLAAILAGNHNLDASVLRMHSLKKALFIDNLLLHDIKNRAFQDWHEWGRFLNMTTRNIADTPIINLANHAEQEPAALKILLVDDDRIQLHFLQTFLVKQGYQVSLAENAEQALKLLLINKPDIIVCDFKMAPIDGMKFCQMVKKHPSTQSVYFILITTDHDESVMSSAFDNGANDFILKPLKGAEIAARIRGAQISINMQRHFFLEREMLRRQAYDLASANRHQRKLALTDHLTNLPNRRYATNRLDEQWSIFIRHQRCFALSILDLDHFKTINDQFGHAVGDQVLMHFAEVLRNSIRTCDLACRMGGEEFLVITPDADEDSIYGLIERIRLEVELNQPEHLRLLTQLTVSIGAALADQGLDRTGWQNTLERADEALYQAKAAGRNTVRIHGQPKQAESGRAPYSA
jgi:diguanylate cyclase (GGDEF)-like protein